MNNKILKMQMFWTQKLLVRGAFFMFVCFTSLVYSQSEEKSWGIWLYGGAAKRGKAMELCRGRPWIHGAFVTAKWAEIEPKPNVFYWDDFDADLTECARAGLAIQFIAYVGPASPEWIYSNGVPKVDTSTTIDPHGRKREADYPFYLDEDYKKYYWRMIRAIAAHIDTLPPRVRNAICSVQTAEGCTGDENGYKGEPTNPSYRLPITQWNAFKFETWKLFGELYLTKSPQIHLLINSGNEGQYDKWLKQNLPGTWRKAGSIGHGYQLSDEVRLYKVLDPLINHYDENGNICRARSEMDETDKGWFSEASSWNMYWLNLWCLTFGLDIFEHGVQSISNPVFDEGFRFFSKYAGEKNPAASPGAFCALHDGLDGADTQRFPVAKFGSVGYGKEGSGGDRAVRIANSFSAFGAKQEDVEKGQAGGGPKGNRDAKAMNDVSWNIWADNYSRYLRQIDANATSQGWWRVGSKDQPFGRFARGFDHAHGKDVMYFDLDDRFFTDKQKPHEVNIRVVYFDKGKGSWELKFDSLDQPERIGLNIQNTDSGKWKEAVVAIKDGRFNNRGPRSSDIELVNTSNEDTIFHMVELTRKEAGSAGPPPREREVGEFPPMPEEKLQETPQSEEPSKDSEQKENTPSKSDETKEEEPMGNEEGK
jgi:hypothetical protein